MKQLKIFWQFCRPHTIFGSIFSVVTLYILTIKNTISFGEHIGILLLTLIASLACNIFIVGLNQIIDVELDKINKPTLPLAAGTMELQSAKKIIFTSLVLSIIIAFFTSYILGILIIVICFIGYAYSAPSIQLKKHHLPAAISITLVRGLLVNLGMYVHFRYCIFAIGVTNTLPAYLLPLTVFIVAFSIAIAWFKDLPDTEGDAQFAFKTLSVLYSKKAALIGGSIIVVLAYLFCIGWSFVQEQNFLLIAHSILLVLFMINTLTIQLNNAKSIKHFYLRFWVLFFMEYIVFAVWVFV